MLRHCPGKATLSIWLAEFEFQSSVFRSIGGGLTMLALFAFGPIETPGTARSSASSSRTRGSQRLTHARAEPLQHRPLRRVRRGRGAHGPVDQGSSGFGSLLLMILPICRWKRRDLPVASERAQLRVVLLSFPDGFVSDQHCLRGQNKPGVPTTSQQARPAPTCRSAAGRGGGGGPIVLRPTQRHGRMRS